MALNTNYVDADYNSYTTIPEMDNIIAAMATVIGNGYGWSELDQIAKENLI